MNRFKVTHPWKATGNTLLMVYDTCPVTKIFTFKLPGGCEMAWGASAATFADILDTNLSSLGLHFLSLTSSMSDSSSVSVKEVQGVLMGPTSGAVNLITLD